MAIVLEVENIGGLAGKHRFEFEEGLSEIVAPNAMGKTSIVKALLAMYTPDVDPTELLNYDADEGYIRVEVDGGTFLRKFKREGGRVVEVESSLVATDDRIKYAILDPQLGEVVKRLVLEAKPDITDYLTKVFKLDEYEKRRDALKLQIRELERDIEYLKRDIEDLAKADQEKKELEGERVKLEEELEKLKAVSVERVREISERIGRLEKRMREIEVRIKDLEEKLIPMTEERIEELRLEIERLKSIVSGFYERYKEPDKHVESIKERIKKVDDFLSALENELKERVAGEDARIPVVKMAVLTKAMKCPICGLPVERPEEFWNLRLRDVEDEVRRSKESIIRDYEERISRAKDERASLWKELEEFTKKYNEVREVEAIRLPKHVAQLEEATKDLEKYRKEIDRLKSDRDSIAKELEDLKRGLSEEEKRAAEKRAEIERRLGEIEQKIRDLEEYITKKGESGRRLTEASKKVEELKKELERTERELYNTLTTMKDEFAKIALEVIRELGFSWLKSIRLVEDEAKKSFEVKVVRAFPSGREAEQSLKTLSTSERSALSLIVVLTGYKLRMLEEYKGRMPILADEALLAFDPQRFEKVIEELKRYGKYVIVTRLARPDEMPRLTVLHKR